MFPADGIFSFPPAFIAFRRYFDNGSATAAVCSVGGSRARLALSWLCGTEFFPFFYLSCFLPPALGSWLLAGGLLLVAVCKNGLKYPFLCVVIPNLNASLGFWGFFVDGVFKFLRLCQALECRAEATIRAVIYSIFFHFCPPSLFFGGSIPTVLIIIISDDLGLSTFFCIYFDYYSFFLLAFDKRGNTLYSQLTGRYCGGQTIKS